jgi:hypothetical protein
MTAGISAFKNPPVTPEPNVYFQIYHIINVISTVSIAIVPITQILRFGFNFGLSPTKSHPCLHLLQCPHFLQPTPPSTVSHISWRLIQEFVYVEAILPVAVFQIFSKLQSSAGNIGVRTCVNGQALPLMYSLWYSSLDSKETHDGRPLSPQLGFNSLCTWITGCQLSENIRNLWYGSWRGIVKQYGVNIRQANHNHLLNRNINRQNVHCIHNAYIFRKTINNTLLIRCNLYTTTQHNSSLHNTAHTI